jgi:hypothetical protein
MECQTVLLSYYEGIATYFRAKELVRCGADPAAP